MLMVCAHAPPPSLSRFLSFFLSLTQAPKKMSRWGWMEGHNRERERESELMQLTEDFMLKHLK